MTLSGKTLSINSVDTNLNSIEIPLEYKAQVAANGATIESLPVTFKVTLW